MAKSDASTVRQVVAVALGWLSNVTEAKLHRMLLGVGQTIEIYHLSHETCHVEDPLGQLHAVVKIHHAQKLTQGFGILWSWELANGHDSLG